MSKSTKKNKMLLKLLAGFRRNTPFHKGKKKEEEMLERMRNSTYFRGRPRFRSELLKGRNKREKEKLRKEEEALGITALV